MSIARDANAHDQRAEQRPEVGSKKFVQQGHRQFYAQSVLTVASKEKG